MPALLLLTAVIAATPSPHPLQYSTTEDLSVTGAAAVIWGVETLLQSDLAPGTCKWCDRNADGTDSLNSVDHWGKDLIWDNRGTANTLSNVMIIALPFGVAGADWALSHAGGAETHDTLADLVMIAEATAIDGAINQGMKYVAGRQRPYAHYGLETAPSSEDNLSFYSEHSSLSFTLVTSFGTIAEMRGYPYAWAIWAVGIPFATATAYFRVAAAKHYVTDVLAGAAIGAAIGAGVPLLFHHRIGSAQVQLVPGPSSVALVGIF